MQSLPSRRSETNKKIISEKISETITLNKLPMSRYLHFFLFTVTDVDDIRNFSETKESPLTWPKIDAKQLNEYVNTELTVYQRPFSLLGIPQNGLFKSCEKIYDEFFAEHMDNEKKYLTFPRNRSSRFGFENVPRVNELPILINHFEKSRMDVILNTNKIVLVNRELIWVPCEQVRIFNLNVSLNIPDGLFGILTGTVNDTLCECVTELITTENVISISLINLSSESVMLLPGDIELVINILPCYIPEPWETYNFPSPNFIKFSLITNKDFYVESNNYTIQNFDYMFDCPDELKALIIANKEILCHGLVVETNIWLKNTTPSVKIFNPTSQRIFVQAGICIATIIFTCGHFILKLLPNRVLNQLAVLDKTSMLWFQYSTE